MSNTAYIAPCLLCGRMIFDSKVRNAPTWLNQFRILYSFNDAVSITGVGYYKDGSFDRWVAPPNYNARWDDEGYNAQEGHRIGVLRQPPMQGRWGVAFHEACWSLLEAAMAPTPLPLQRLLDLCRSFPIPNFQYSPDWGHHYGGLDLEHPEDGLCVDIGEPTARHHRHCITRISKLDPSRLPDLFGLCYVSSRSVIWVNENLPLPPQQRMPGAILRGGATLTRSSDPFASLPEELRVAVAALLPTRDFLSLRLASPLFAPMFHQQLFWATRFAGPGRDRGWLFEARTWDKATVDWRRLYVLTSPAHRSPPMHNRARVWLLALHITALLTPRFASPTRAASPLRMKLAGWRTAAVEVQRWNAERPYMGFSFSCTSLRESWPVTLPPLIDRISFFLSWIGEVQFVVGLKVVGTCGTVVELGYMDQEISVAVSGRALAGIYLALAPKGIKAVRCVFADGTDAPWIGSLANTAQTSKLVSSGTLSAIAARFDGCRIVSLSIIATAWAPASLRDVALWERSIPDRSLQLNNDTFSLIQPDSGFYEPIHRSVFGGTRGQSLRYLTGINACLMLEPCGIEFEFAPGHLDYLDTCEDLGVFPESDLVTMQHFAIDGPGGERITGVELYIEGSDLDSDADISLNSFKVFTNRGRSHHFRRERLSSQPILTPVMVPVPPGATITGFYCTMFNNYIYALGVMTEMLG